MNFNQLIETAFESYPALTQKGTVVSQEEIDKVAKNLVSKIPEWYLELLIRYPLSNMEFGIPFDYGWTVLDDVTHEAYPLMNTYFMSLEEMVWNMSEAFPACELIKEGYICIAPTDTIDGDGFYIDGRLSDPKVIYIYHDLGETTDELIKYSTTISETFSEFLQAIRPNETTEAWEARTGLKII